MQIAGNAPALEKIADPDGKSRRVSRVCGSTIDVALSLDQGRVCSYWQKTNACVLGQASASILAHNIVGCTPAELRQLRNDVEAMLKDGAPPPAGKWTDMQHLLPVRDYPQRHASTMLVFNAVVECLDQIEAEQA